MRKALCGWLRPKFLPLLALASKTDRVHLFIWAQGRSVRHLKVYEDRVPGDLRPRRSFEGGWLWANGFIRLPEVRKAILLFRQAAME